MAPAGGVTPAEERVYHSPEGLAGGSSSEEKEMSHLTEPKTGNESGDRLWARGAESSLRVAPSTASRVAAREPAGERQCSWL